MKNDDDARTPVEHNYKKKPRKRSVFDLEQIRQLENVFDRVTHYPDLSLRQRLTEMTQLPDKKIQVDQLFNVRLIMSLHSVCLVNRFGFKIGAPNGENKTIWAISVVYMN